MIATIVIIALSLPLLVYWFRSACVFLLCNWNEENAREVAEQNDLSFSAVEGTLAKAGTAQDLDRIKDLLDRDLRTVLDLMAQCQGHQDGSTSLECRMLRVYYAGLQLLFAAARNATGTKAQNALREMSRVVAYLAGEIGESSATAGA